MVVVQFCVFSSFAAEQIANRLRWSVIAFVKRYVSNGEFG